MKPSGSMFPIVRCSQSNEVVGSAGSGFFCGTPMCGVTARHVLNAEHLGVGESFACVVPDTTGRAQVYAIPDWTHSEKIDLAIFRPGHIPNSSPLAIVPGDCPSDVRILCYEFSTTRHERREDGKWMSRFAPATHMGNVLHCFDNPTAGSSGERCLKLSFPALKGASGAAVLRESDFAVVGMVIANIEQELLPAQILEIVDGDHYREKITYYLPNGMAIATDPLIRELQSADVHLELRDGWGA